MRVVRVESLCLRIGMAGVTREPGVEKLTWAYHSSPENRASAGRHHPRVSSMQIFQQLA